MLHRFLFLCLLWPALAGAAPTKTITVDIDKTEALQSLTFLQATDPRVAFKLMQGGRQYTDLNGYTAKFMYGTSITGAAVTVESETTDPANGQIVFQFDSADTNTNGTFRAVLLVEDASTNRFYYGQVNLTITRTSFTTGAADLDLGQTVDWIGTDYENTAMDGPYKAGSGISFSAPDGTGRVAVNATGAMPDVMLGSVYDANTNGVVDAAELFGGLLPSSYATTGEVAAAIAAVHDPVTVTNRLTLVGQMVGLPDPEIIAALEGQVIQPAHVSAFEALYLKSGWDTYMQPGGNSGTNTVFVSGKISVSSSATVGGSAVLTAASTLDASKLTGTLPALDGSSLTNIPTPQWAVEWGPGEIVGPFYDGSNDAAGWARKAEVNGTYVGVAGMGMSSSLTTLQDVTIFVHRHTPKTSTALDANAAFELTFWTTTASAADQKFDLVILGSNRSGGGQTQVYAKTGIVGAAGVVTTLVIPTGSVSYLEKSDGTVTNQAESLSSSTLYRLYTFKIVAYSKSSNRVNFVGGVINGR